MSTRIRNKTTDLGYAFYQTARFLKEKYSIVDFIIIPTTLRREYTPQAVLEMMNTCKSNLVKISNIVDESNNPFKGNTHVVESTGFILDYSKSIENINNSASFSMMYGKPKTLLELVYFVVVAAMLLFIVSSQSSEISSDITKLNFDQIEENLEKSPVPYVYRGQAKSDWPLCPSIYRDYQNKGKTILITKKEIKALYDIKNTGLIKKYLNVFQNDDVDENFLAFCQHSTSYSPFIDFTNRFDVACIFACSSNGNQHFMNYKDGKVFAVKDKTSDLTFDNCFNNLDIFIAKGKFNLFNVMKNKKILGCLTIDDLKPSYIILKSETNDRMRVQHGCFLFVYKGFIINDCLILGPRKSDNISAYEGIIGRGAEKKSLYNYLVKKRPYISYDNLMNPYQYFASNDE
ncbi:MAG: FRG domain-containing protein [Bacteroidales bacterium]